MFISIAVYWFEMSGKKKSRFIYKLDVILSHGMCVNSVFLDKKERNFQVLNIQNRFKNSTIISGKNIFSPKIMLVYGKVITIKWYVELVDSTCIINRFNFCLFRMRNGRLTQNKQKSKHMQQRRRPKLKHVRQLPMRPLIRRWQKARLVFRVIH